MKDEYEDDPNTWFMNILLVLIVIAAFPGIMYHQFITKKDPLKEVNPWPAATVIWSLIIAVPVWFFTF